MKLPLGAPIRKAEPEKIQVSRPANADGSVRVAANGMMHTALPIRGGTL